MGNKMIHQIDKQLRQASGNFSEAFVRFTVVLVSNFQKLSPVVGTEMYQLDNSLGSLAYDTFQNVVSRHESHRHDGQDNQD